MKLREEDFFMNAEILSPLEERILKIFNPIRCCTSYFRKFHLNIIFLTQFYLPSSFFFRFSCKILAAILIIPCFTFLSLRSTICNSVGHIPAIEDNSHTGCHENSCSP